MGARIAKKAVVKKTTKKTELPKSISLDIASNGYIVNLEYGHDSDWRVERIVCVGRDAVIALIEDTLAKIGS